MATVLTNIYIKAEEMPHNCMDCRLMRRCGEKDLDYVCSPANIYVEEMIPNAYTRPEWCPLVPVESVQPKIGYWIVEPPNGFNSFRGNVNCSVCGYPDHHEENYCHHCGAKMEDPPHVK